MADDTATESPPNGDVDVKRKKQVSGGGVDTSFGVGSMRTKALKGSHHLVIFAVLSGLMGMFSGIVKSTLNGQVTSFEKHFNFETLSIATSLFMNEYIGMLSVVFTSGFIANYQPIPRMTGVTGILSGIIMAAIPGLLNHFHPFEWPTLPKMPDGFPNYFTCNLSPNITLPPPPENDGKLVYSILLGGAMANYGVLAAIRWGPMPFLFYDNNVVNKGKVGLYLAITIVISEFSRPFGYLFNDYVSKMAVDLEDKMMPPEHPMFVTAWWLGPVVFGCMTIVVSIPMLFLPPHLLSSEKMSEQVKKASVKAVHRSIKIGSHAAKDDVGFLMRGQNMTTVQKVKAYFKGLPRIFTNPLFLTLFVLWGIIVIPVVGLSLANMQYTMFYYNIDADEAQKGEALSNFLANVLAAVAGAAVCSRIERKKDYLTFIMCCVFVSFVILPVSFFLGCDNVPIYGIDEPKFGANVTKHAVSCPCDYAPKIPTCGSDGKNYLNPCHAGCTMASPKGYFFDCKNVDVGSMAVPKLCPDDCHQNFVGFTALFTVSTFIYKMADIPKILLALRLIKPKDRGIAFSTLGFANVISSTIGPLILLKFFNDNCLVWLTDSICLYFDRDDLRMLKTGVEFHTYIFAFIMWFVLAKLNNLADKKLRDKTEAFEKNQKEIKVENENSSHRF